MFATLPTLCPEQSSNVSVKHEREEHRAKGAYSYFCAESGLDMRWKVKRQRGSKGFEFGDIYSERATKYCGGLRE